ncbi:MAG TPA: hypothetical protein DCG12_05315 [Planctomycetaceae bacterium]|nr:hypothetical protein [Planctomycetaceae bacterium]
MIRALVPLALAVCLAPCMADDISVLRAVGGGAQGAAKARAARDSLVDGGAKNLIPILTAFKGSSTLATNWLRSAFEAIADAEQKAGKSLPKSELLKFVADTTQSPEARRLAYEWLLKRRPELADELIPGMLLDPSPDFRRDAVARLIIEAKAAGGNSAVDVWKKALRGAVHEDQVKEIAKALRDSEVEVNLQKHFGFLSSWKIAGPFDNRDEAGFAAVYAPEKKLDLEASYEGSEGEVKWQPVASDDDYGVVDIAEALSNYKGSLMYATTTYNSSKAQDLEVRLGTPNAWKLWVNGKLVFQREEYHRGTRMDQYKVPVSLQAGANIILLKVCQNEQTQPWAQKYQFQLRVCDSTGSGVAPSARAVSLSQKGASK